jgi:probable F420-dependent oxidoreductase
MRFGLRLPSFALGVEPTSLADMGAYLRRAEDLGFESAFLIDHLLVAPPAYRTTWLEPVSLLAALAGVTRTMRLGTLVLVLPFRDPVAFAKEWATLDWLSGGRTILGVGVGWHEGEFAALRIPFRERGGRMNETLESITALWAGDHVTYEGQFYRFEDLSIDPKPIQRPHPPIWIGGTGRRRTLPIAGRHADVWHGWADDAADLREMHAIIDRAAEEEGRDPASVLRASSLSISEPWDEVRAAHEWMARERIGYLMIDWPSEGRGRLEEFLADVLPSLG